MKENDEIKSEQSHVIQRVNFGGANDGQICKEIGNNLSQQTDVSNNQNVDTTIVEDHLQNQGSENLNEHGSGINDSAVITSTENQLRSVISTDEATVDNVNTKQPQLSMDEQNTHSNNTNNRDLTRTEDENGFFFILRVQQSREDLASRRESENAARSRSRSPNNRVRPISRRRRRRRRSQWEVTAQESPAVERPPIQESEIAYELITMDTIEYKRSKTWQLVPKYKSLTGSEVVKQEADLYYSFLKEKKPERVETAGPNDRRCCICFENKATRIVVPCGHLCLCYNCAKTIACNRTRLSSMRVQKKCPLCRAAMSKIMRLL